MLDIIHSDRFKSFIGMPGVPSNWVKPVSVSVSAHWRSYAQTHKYTCLHVLPSSNKHNKWTRYLPHCNIYIFVCSPVHVKPPTRASRIGMDIQSQTTCLSTSYSQSHTNTHTRTHIQIRTQTLDWSQRLPSACVCMLAYCTRECVILMCESEWIGVEMSLLIFGKYSRSDCYMLSGPMLILWGNFRQKLALEVQLGQSLQSLRALRTKCFLFVVHCHLKTGKQHRCDMHSFMSSWSCCGF